MVAIFTYGFDLAAERFKEAGVPLVTLSNYGALIEEATAEGIVGQSETELLQEWRRDPANWNR